MKISIGIAFGLWVALLWLTGNASWILALVNILWLFFKGAPLMSWWIPGGCVATFVVLLVALIAAQLWARD